MGIPLGLLVKEQFQFPCFGWTLRVCLVFIVLTVTTSLACGGGAWSGGLKPKLIEVEKDGGRVPLDEARIVNMTGIIDPVDRNIKSGWNGWKPDEETLKEWKKFHADWLEENAKNGELPQNNKKLKKGEVEPPEPGDPGWTDFSHERGPDSGWPKLEGWSELGAGSGGAPAPSWSLVPKNTGKPSICYLPPLMGKCPKRVEKSNIRKWGYNAFLDECRVYVWSGCRGTRNRFDTRARCEKHCMTPQPSSCSSDSGILDRSKIKNKLED